MSHERHGGRIAGYVCERDSSKITGTVAARWWIDAKAAPRVASAARQLGGRDPDLPAATAALTRAAASLGARR